MIDLEHLKLMVKEGWVSERKHPHFRLSIYNYTAKCQWEKNWNETTLQCRGLILDEQGKVVSLPFRKFFNEEEHSPEEIPWHLPCEITEKLDGSLLILFYYQGEWCTATRGSFDSDQAIEGRKIFEEKYSFDYLCKGITYLAEVIYPENRIIVDYGQKRDVIILGMIDSQNNIEFSLTAAHKDLSLVKQYATTDPRSVREIIKDDEEGYVLRFSNGFRIKIKGVRYKQLHRLLSRISSRMVWEYLSQGKDFQEILERVPDEFQDWIKQEKETLRSQYMEILWEALDGYIATLGLPTRKEKALLVQKHYVKVAAIIFSMIDGKQYATLIWKMIYPEYRIPKCSEKMEV